MLWLGSRTITVRILDLVKVCGLCLVINHLRELIKMKKLRLMTKLFCLSALFFAGSVQAVVLDFKPSSLGVAQGIHDSVSISNGGITANITAFTITNNGAGSITGTTLLSGGTGVFVASETSKSIGVTSGSETGNLDGGDNAADPDEGLLFAFNKQVILDFIDFDSFSVSGGDDFNLTVDGVLVLFGINSSSVSPLIMAAAPGSPTDEFRFNNIIGTNFLFWADDVNDSFRIDTIEVSAVPVPAAAWLFGSALIGLFGFSRRKKS